ncbi:MAG: hypothetical protein H6581_26500 [Bacteroidia bacterium]|nr:hypothetical protein [Bacteroidia bacterium]
MNYFSLIIILAILGLIGLGVWYFLMSREAAKAAKRASDLLKEIDEKYEKFATQQLSNNILGNGSQVIDPRKLNRDLMVFLKPQVDALISHINATTIAQVSISYRSKYFPNLVTMTESSFRTSQSSPGRRLLGHDENRFYEAIKDGVAADLAKRRLDGETHFLVGND